MINLERKKALQRERVQRYRDKQKSVTSEGVTGGVTIMSWEEQQRRFPNIPLPFGPAYYKALAEKT